MKKTVQHIKLKVFITVFLAILGFISLQAQDTIISERIYKENIKTIQLFREGWRLSYPVIDLYSEVNLILKFDDLSEEIKNYNYRIVHCDSEWRPTGLNETEYLSGMIQDQIDDYNYSFNTYTSYVHYTLNLPNQNISFRLSGNYAIIVYEGFDETNVAFVKRFMVTEKIVKVDANVTRPILSAYRDIGHQVNFNINYGSFRLEDPYSDIRVVIMQNGRWDNVITDLKPLFDRNGTLVYDYQMENVFMAGKEYRWFDIKSLRYQSPYIKSVDFDVDNFYVTLFPDEDRSNKVYFFEEDINGKFYVEVQEESNNDTDAEYVFVDFEFPTGEPAVTGDYYIMGELSNWQFTERNKMKYDFNSSSYKLRLRLKQGYYNYHIGFLEKGSEQADLSYAEGNSYETENDYLIFVYHYGTTSRYERLIGYQIINSLRRK